MAKKFVNCESYMHNCAKEVFASWLWEEEYMMTQYGYNIGATRLCRKPMLEYPCVNYNNYINYNNCNSLNNLIDEVTGGEVMCPTFDQCKEKGWEVVAIFDIATAVKGTVYEAFEICHTHPVPKEKINKIKTFLEKKNKIKFMNSPFDLYEIQADWILKQTKKPSIIQVKKLI